MAIENQIAVKGQQLLRELESAAGLTLPALSDDARRVLVDYKYNEIGIAGVEQRKRELERFLSDYAADLASLPAQELRLNHLQEEVASAERLYQTWLEQANSTQIAKAVQSASVGNLIALIEPAKLPLSPFAPEKTKILALAMMMGVVLGFGGAVVSEYLDLTMKSVSEIEAVLDLPILGAVPKMQASVVAEAETRRVRKVRILVVSLILTAVGLAAAGYFYFTMPFGAG